MGTARVVIVSGPSGVGKGTIIRRVLADATWVHVAISATTRPPRPGEADGRDYHFMSPERFAEASASGELLEEVEFAGSRYGTLRSEVVQAMDRGATVLIECEPRGARAIREAIPARAVFIVPPSAGALADRLRGRGTEDERAIARRLAAAESEIARSGEYDVVITNDDLDAACAALRREL